MEPDKKPPTDRVHHKIGRYYHTLNHTCLTQETLFNIIYSWIRDFYVVSNHHFSFVLHPPHSIFTFTHHVQLIIEEMDYDVEVEVDPDSMAVELYNPLALREYVRLVEVELLKMREALSQALEDRAYAEKEAISSFLIIGDYFYKKII